MRKHLQSEQMRLSANNDSLKSANRDFLLTKDALLYDNDTLSVYARQLGYSRGNEEFIRIMGLGIAARSDLPTGQVFYSVAPSHVSDNMIKIISLLFGLAILVFFLINDFYIIKNKFAAWFYEIRGRVLSR
jgi:hypothetical protein